MNNNRREFYENIVNDSLNQIRTRQNIYRKNNSKRTKNGMIRFDDAQEKPVKSKFFTQFLVCVCIVGGFFYLTNSDSKLANDIVEKSKTILNTNINLDDKLNKILDKFNIKIGADDNNVSIDESVIEQMEEEAQNQSKN